MSQNPTVEIRVTVDGVEAIRARSDKLHLSQANNLCVTIPSKLLTTEKHFLSGSQGGLYFTFRASAGTPAAVALGKSALSVATAKAAKADQAAKNAASRVVGIQKMLGIKS